MYRLRSLLTDSRFLSIVGIAALTAFFFLGASTLKVALIWAAIASGVLLAVWGVVWWVRRRRARQAGEAIGSMLETPDEKLQKKGASASAAEIETLKKRMHEAIRTIRGSKLGQVSGAEALYELPWYITIGNPAAGKSTAIVNSGLKFPFDDGGNAIIKGIGGTRNCDWFFTTEGILLDTAGRYSVHEEDREEWLGFLQLLKKNRPHAPINGIIVTVSIGELIGNSPAFAISLAKNLRQRVQELTEKLEVFAPVYVLFTKADLIPGFHDFFLDLEWTERDRVWGATIPYEQSTGNELIALFDRHFDELYEGLRAMSVAQLSRVQGENTMPGLLIFPSEFAAIKNALRAFVATLFEDNPFQFKPVFRGFYITSATQSNDITPISSERVQKRFALQGGGSAGVRTAMTHGYFLKELFSKVIFPDRNLVRRHTTRFKMRLRQVAVLGALGVLGLTLGGWSWSYLNNRSLLENVQQDITKAIRLQEGRIDLQSRLEAMAILQDRLVQLERFNEEHPLSIGLGLYQGREMADKLRTEYFNGINSVMLTPVKENLEAFLIEVNLPGNQLRRAEAGNAGAIQRTAASGPYRDAIPSDVEDGYNALKTYLMLSSREHVDAGHLSDQITRFWRGWLEANRGTMSREQMIRSAGSILSFHLEHASDPQWPLITTNLALVDEVRDKLRRVVRGMPAAERVYAEIKARASTRFAPVTVANIVGPDNASLVTGSSVVSGTFTAEAWREYVQGAIKEAATSAQKNADWVLMTSTSDDLTLEGSPEQIQKTLIAMYKQDYVEEWKRFVQGVSVASFASFPEAVAAMGRIGDPQNSPIGTLVKVIFDQTAWDNPSVANLGLERAQKGFIEWFKRSILRMSPSRVQVDVNVAAAKGIPMGPVGQEFAGVARLVVPRDGGDPLIDTYLSQLSKLRTRLNQLKNQGDPGAGALRLMRDTLSGSNSELAETLRYVDEQMLTGIPDNQRNVLRPLLLRPLLQTYAAIIRPASEELNKTWVAQVQEPFSRKLAIKYPFSPQAGIEAGPAEIAQIFGPEGAVAKFAESALGGLVERRGNTITPRTWGDLGLALQADFMSGFSRWVAPLEGGVAADNQGTSQAQTVFMLRPQPAAGTIGYVVEVDGQKLNYRNGASQWANFIWPNPAGTPGARILATTFDGETVDIINFPGRFGLEKMINSAARTRLSDGAFRLKWANRGVEVSIDLRLLSSPQAQSGRSNDGGGERNWNGLSLPTMIAQVEPVAASAANETPASASAPAAPAAAAPLAAPAPATAGGAQ